LTLFVDPRDKPGGGDFFEAPQSYEITALKADGVI
jgi:hypothetical protein